MAANDVTLKELAGATGVSYQNLSRIVNGQNPTITTAEKIAAVTGVSVWKLWPNVYKYENYFRHRSGS
jgi:transcriptional regulator with XRE-family HTH domain